MSAKVTGLIPMAHAVDVQRSGDFYRLLGMEIRGSLRIPQANCAGFTWRARTRI